MDDVPPRPRSADRARFKSEWWLPAPSVFLPGFGQYFQGEWSGLMYSGIGVGGLFLASDGLSKLRAENVEDVPESPTTGTESPAEREFILGSLAYQGSGFLSAYAAFRSSVPRFQAEDGKYKFLTSNEPVGALMVSPARFEHLAKASAFIPLGLLAAGATYLVVDERSSHHGADWTFSADDILFSWPLAYNAGVTEEALFRGWLLPMAYQYTGQTWWLANGAQAALFGLAHYGPGNRLPWPQALLGYYFGYLTRKNGWSLSEAVFVHSWWDAILFTAQYATMRRVPAGSAGFRFDLPVPL
jgi:membrane protease YdiL (CAAX protease family)